MRNETLLNRAEANFKAAKANWAMREDDDFFINLTGYLLQQSVELFLKHHLEINGIKYPHTHDLDTLISMLPDPDSLLSMNLQLYAGTITTWESKTRYIKNYFLEKRNVEMAFKLIEPLFNKDLGDMSCFD